jgi:hypothetical protein
MRVPGLPDTLYFKDNKAALEHYCRFCPTEIGEKKTIAALVLDPTHLACRYSY